MLEEFPWLDAADLSGEPRKMDRPWEPIAGEDLEEASEREEGADPEVDPEEIDVPAAAAELAALREEHEWDEHEGACFYSRLLGGAWAKAHTGDAADGSSGFARAGPPTAWRVRFGWARSRSYMLGRYGRDGACALSREWARRADYFYRLFLDAGDPAFTYKQYHVDACPESEVFLDYLTGLVAEDPVFSSWC